MPLQEVPHAEAVQLFPLFGFFTLLCSALLLLLPCVMLAQATNTTSDQSASVAIIPAAGSPSEAQSVPRLIMLSGTIKDSTGKPLTGTMDLNFAIYKDQSASLALWDETQALNLDEQGHYTVLLGAMQPEGLPVDLFTSGEARWLGVSAGKLPEQPRILLVSVPYALKANDAEMLGGKPASAYALAQPLGALSLASAATAGATAPGEAPTPDMATPRKPKSGPKPNVGGTGTQNYIPIWTDNSGTLGNSVMYQSSGLVGVGTTSPAVALDVYGSNAGLQLSGTGTHQVTVTGATSGRLGQDAVGFFFSSDTNSAALRFGTNNGSGHEWMRITSAGNVGIGTTTPAHVLDVVGDISASTNIAAGGNLSVTGTITGNGAGLTGVTASGLAAGTYPNALTFSSGSNSFSGNGSGLTSLNPANISSGTAGISVTGNAATATSATTATTAADSTDLNGVPGTSYARLDTANSFTGNQGISGNVGIGTAAGTRSLYVVSPASNLAAVKAVGQTASSIGSGLSTWRAGVWGDSAGGQGILASSDSNNAIVAYNNTSSAAPTIYAQNGQSGGEALAAGGAVLGCIITGWGTIQCGGGKAAEVGLSDGRTVLLYALESPQVWFEDFGSGTLAGGVASVALDPVFADTVNTQLQYHVFLTPLGDCEGLYVDAETPTGFEVRELKGGNSNVPFDYRVVALRKGWEDVRLTDVTDRSYQKIRAAALAGASAP